MGVLTTGADYEAVLEKFVGGNHPEFKVIEKELVKIIAMIRKDVTTTSNKIEIHKINKSDSNKLIEAQLKKFFGVRKVLVSWTTDSTPNAYTYCKTFMFADQNYKESKDGRHSNNRLFLNVQLHTGLVTAANLNEKEILAIILHEVGHNFFTSILHTMSVTGMEMYSMAIAGALDLVNYNQIVSETNDGIRNFMSKNFPAIYKSFNSMGQLFKNIGSLFPRFLQAILQPIQIANLITMQYYTRYSVEKAADSFAVDHGYGLPLATALDKLVKEEGTLGGRTVRSIPAIAWMYDLVDLEIEILGGILGIYPSNQNRIRTGLDNLKRSMNDPDVSPELKKEIAAQIDMYTKYYEGVYLNPNENRNRIFVTAYRRFVEATFNGKMDLREIIEHVRRD